MAPGPGAHKKTRRVATASPRPPANDAHGHRWTMTAGGRRAAAAAVDCLAADIAMPPSPLLSSPLLRFHDQTLSPRATSQLGLFVAAHAGTSYERDYSVADASSFSLATRPAIRNQPWTRFCSSCDTAAFSPLVVIRTDGRSHSRHSAPPAAAVTTAVAFSSTYTVPPRWPIFAWTRATRWWLSTRR